MIITVFVATCTVCNGLHAWARGQKNEQQNNACYKGPVKLALLKGTGLLLYLNEFIQY